MKFLIPIAMLCLALAGSAMSDDPCLCTKEMAPVCGRGDCKNYQWFNNACLRDCVEAGKAPDSKCDQSLFPGQPIFQ